MESLSEQVLPVLSALPDVERVVSERATYSNKQVREIEFIDAVPVSPSGKILRRLLRSP